MPTAPTLADVTKAEAQARAAAEKAQAEAARLQQAAAEAKRRADDERDQANRAFLAKLDAETPAQLKEARAAVSAALAAFDEAVTTDGQPIAAYRAYIDASVTLWKLQKALADQRSYFGMPAQAPQQPGFSFVTDLSASLGRYAMQQIGDAETAVKEERRAFLEGRS